MASRRPAPAGNRTPTPVTPVPVTPAAATPAPANPAAATPAPANPAAATPNRTGSRSEPTAPPQPVSAANMAKSTAAHVPSVTRPPIPPPPITDSKQNINKFIIITERESYDKLLNDVGRKHLLVEFYAPWCGACMLINKTLEELAIAYDGKLIIAKVNVEECEEIAIDNGVTMMPAFMLMKEKQVLEKFAGSNEEKLMNTIKKFMGEPNEARPTLAEVPQNVSTAAAISTPPQAPQALTPP